MSKMTDEQIIKALECCIKSTSDCDNCPLHITGDGDCTDKAKQGALDIINRQQTEIEKLNVELVGMRGACNSYKMHYDNAKAEMESLKADKIIAERHEKDARELYKDVVIQLKTAKAEAIKDILLTLEAEARSSDKYIEEYDDSKEQKAYNQALWKAYNLVKEMVGEGK